MTGSMSSSLSNPFGSSLSVALIAAACLLGAACDKPDSGQDNAASAADSAAASLSSASATDAANDAASSIRLNYDYKCESGHAIAAAYNPEAQTAVIEYKDETHHLSIAVSASGARYIGDSLVWWTKGSGTGSSGTLYHLTPDFNTGDVIEECTSL